VSTSTPRSLAAPAFSLSVVPLSVLLSAARVALGILWLREGIVKYRAGFGEADILLVADGATSNTRIPEFFTFFADHVLRPSAELAGLAVPLVEVGLGVALIAGVLTLPIALASLVNLMTYWCSDLLVGEYPIMGVLSGLLIAWPTLASRFSVSAIVRSRRSRTVPLSVDA
jgi:thiosulfate dehydrogenase (quinone) large subunit